VAYNHIVTPAQPALIFVNPAGGGGKALSFLPRIRDVFEDFNIPAEFVSTATALEMTLLARKAIEEGRKLLAVMGGDGTLQELVNTSYGADVVLGVVPVGGGNDFATALGLPKDPVDAAKEMLRGSPRWVDLIRSRTAEGTERFYVGGGGLGLDAEASRYAGGKFRQVPGRLRYLASALTALWHFKPLKVEASFPDDALADVECDVLICAALNTPTYGAGLRLAPEASLEDGCFDLVFVQSLGWAKVLPLLPRLVVSGELRTSRLTRIRAKHVRLTTNRSCFFHADGEVIGSAPVELEIVPNAFRVLAPKSG
jgi:diacylglycerol kinase (ATP)